MEGPVDHDLRSIEKVDSKGPYVLVGLCVAATLAREIAARLVAKGRIVSLLVMIDPPGPGETRRRFAGDTLTYKIRFTFYRALFHLRRLTAAG